MDKSAHSRFMDKVSKVNGCWIWTGAKDKDGYGVFRHNGLARRAHRLSYIYYKGAIPTGHVIRHSCANLCVNPAHLKSGTQQQNMDDKKR